MNKKILILLIGLILVTGIFFVFYSNEEIKEEREETIKEEEEEIKKLEEIVKEFIGRPYERGPLGEEEGELFYRTDAFDCTTLVLVSVSKLHSNGFSPEEMIKRINYHPQGEVSYETRLHFSTYRNEVIDFFKDITKEIAPEQYRERKVLLNKERDEGGRLIDIDWEEEISFYYVKAEDVPGIISEIPQAVGVAFLNYGDEEIGLDIRHEGFLFNGKDFVHASLATGEVVKESFLEFIENSDYDGVTFFEIKNSF